MIETILEALFGGLIKFAAGWLSQREATRAAQKSAIAIQSAEVHESSDRDQTDSQVEVDRETNNAELAQAATDSTGVNGLRKQSEDINATIAAANRSLR
jgi:hypothetical protein